MKNLLRNVSLSYAAGSLGGLVNTLTVWIFGISGITAAFGVKLAPALTPPWIYQRLVWGGIWGLLFLAPLFKSAPIVRGAICSLGPTFTQLFLVFPFMAGQGMMGLKLGMLTPLFVVLFNLVWGMAASLWLSAIEDRPPIWSWKR
jgi:hypothetical protein